MNEAEATIEVQAEVICRLRREIRDLAAKSAAEINRLKAEISALKDEEQK